jgi:hypothetical protein
VRGVRALVTHLRVMSVTCNILAHFRYHSLPRPLTHTYKSSAMHSHFHDNPVHLADLEARLRASEVTLQALTIKNQELLAEDAELQKSIRAFEDEMHGSGMSFTDYALRTGALKKFGTGKENRIEDEGKSMMRDSGIGPSSDDVDLHTASQALSTNCARPITLRSLHPPQAAPAKSASATPKTHTLNLAPSSGIRHPARDTTATQASAPGPAPRSLAFALPDQDGRMMEIPIETKELAMILRGKLEKVGWHRRDVDDAVEAFVERPVLNVLPRRK